MVGTQSSGHRTARCATADARTTRPLPLLVLVVGLLLTFAQRHAGADPVRDRSMAFFAAVDAADWSTVEKLIADPVMVVIPARFVDFIHRQIMRQRRSGGHVCGFFGIFGDEFVEFHGEARVSRSSD